MVAGLSRAALAVAFGLLLGRILGFVRELALANRFGVTSSADVAILAIAIPDLLTALFVGTAVSAVLIPRWEASGGLRDAEEARRLFRQVAFVLGWTGVVLALLLAVGAEAIVALLAPGFSGTARTEAIWAVRIVLIALPFCPLAAVTTAALQATGRVLAASIGTVVFNGFLVLALVVPWSGEALVVLVATVPIATAARFGYQAWLCGRMGLWGGWTNWFPSRTAHAEGREEARAPSLFRLDGIDATLRWQYGQAVAAIALTLAIPLTSRALATLSPGGLAAYNYANKLMELPLGIATAILAMAVFPRLARHLAGGQPTEAATMARSTTVAVLALGLPVVASLLLVPAPVATLLFAHGRLGMEGIARIAPLLSLAMLALLPLVLSALLVHLYHGQRNTAFPLRVSLGMALLHLPLSLFLRATWGERGLMLALALTSTVGLVQLAAGMSRHGLSGQCWPERRILGPFLLFAALGALLALPIVALPLPTFVLCVLQGLAFSAAIAANLAWWWHCDKARSILSTTSPHRPELSDEPSHQTAHERTAA